jgi:hypothetical protein
MKLTNCGIKKNSSCINLMVDGFFVCCNKGVRLDRVRGGRQKYRRVDGSTPTGIAVAFPLQQPRRSVPSSSMIL